MEKILLILERPSNSEELWGRVDFQDNLIVNSAENLDALEAKMRQVLEHFHGVKPSEVEFDKVYDLTALFQEKNFLKLSAVADRAGINRSLLAQYAAGIKHPSVERAMEIVQAIHSFGNELRSVKLSVKGDPIPMANTEFIGCEFGQVYELGGTGVLESRSPYPVYLVNPLYGYTQGFGSSLRKMKKQDTDQEQPNTGGA